MRLNHAHKKLLRRWLLIPLALLFIAEAWLWDKTGAAIQKLIALLPLEAFKARALSFIDSLSPIRTVALFVIPALVLLPIKFAALWCLAHGFLIGGVSMILLAKLAGLGVSSYLFALCKPKLLQLRWVRWLYEHVVRLRAKAAAMLRPYTNFIHRYARRLRAVFPHSKRIEKIRARMHKARHTF